MAKSVANFLSGYVDVFAKCRPDLLFLLGDRGEMLAAAVAALYLNLPVVHYHGGDISGSIDDSARHAITKLSHVHLASNQASAKRIRMLGENPKNIYVVGTTVSDNIRGLTLGKKYLENKYGVSFDRPLIMVIQHSVPTEEAHAARQMSETLKAVVKFRSQTIIIYPNSDTGSNSMIKVIDQYRKHDFVRVYENIPPQDYLSLLMNSSALVGNSSSGMVEAPFFGLPVINLGNRQHGRTRGGNVIDVPHNSRAIYQALKKALMAMTRHNYNPYRGHGKVASKIVQILSTLKLEADLLNKQITY
jgi:UDP-N-acetylglucosamine 2-epimerase (non-hydrolysing)/GDP/UDP-N,N'-diacetylbacillosamine 2-epimerase (hydrolysing)